MYIYSHTYVFTTLCILIVTYVYSQHYARSLSDICILNTMYIHCHIYLSTTLCTLVVTYYMRPQHYVHCHIYLSTTLCTFIVTYICTHNTVYIHCHIHSIMQTYCHIYSIMYAHCHTRQHLLRQYAQGQVRPYHTVHKHCRINL